MPVTLRSDADVNDLRARDTMCHRCVMAELLKHKSPGQDIDLGVEVAGVEPASPKLSVGLLRAQPMIGFGRLLSIGTPQPPNPQ